jgi:hypothetical protein
VGAAQEMGDVLLCLPKTPGHAMHSSHVGPKRTSCYSKGCRPMIWAMAYV